MKSIILAGTHSGVGKTTISTAIMGALDNVVPFKCGPDYIDPRFHEFITGRSSRNLDIFMCGEEAVKNIFIEGSREGDISVIEGVMGLYDGLDHDLDNGSSAHLSRVLGAPVVLVVDGKGCSTSVAAKVLGFKKLDPRVRIGGVILNNVGSEKLYNLLREAVERYTGIPCVGYFPKNEKVTIGSRHLGLKQAEEIEDLNNTLETLKEMARTYLDLDAIRDLATTAKDLSSDFDLSHLKDRYRGLKVAVARDNAFSFYYKSNLELMEYCGMELISFSPLKNEEVPEGTHFIYIGGGYPENFASTLEKNKLTMDSIREFHRRDIPVYGECGGFMYLCDRIFDKEGNSFKMTGLLDIDVSMKSFLNFSRFGYGNFKTHQGIEGRCHEFHFSDITRSTEEPTMAIDKKDRGWKCGYENKNLLAGYPHIHFMGNLEFFTYLFDRAGER